MLRGSLIIGGNVKIERIDRAMRRLITLLSAAALLGGAFGVGDMALARDHGGGGERRAEAPRGGRGDEERGRFESRGRGDDERGRFEPRGDMRGYGEMRGYYGRPQGDVRADEGPVRFHGPRYAPGYAPRYAPAESAAPLARRGGFLAPEAGGPVPDYRSYRLRQPPRGYAWVRTANGYAMVRMETGQVFDVVPY